MKYGLMSVMMPFILDKTSYKYLDSIGVRADSKMKKKIKKEYKEMIKRTPGLAKGNDLVVNLYIGCYLLAFYKAEPYVVTEQVFEGMIKALCAEMIRREKENDSAFSEKTISMREKVAVESQSSNYEMDWRSTFSRKGDNCYEFTYTKCGLCELGRREGCFHLIKYLCMTDYISFDKAGAKLIRNHTIANGDNYCDFHVERK